MLRSSRVGSFVARSVGYGRMVARAASSRVTVAPFAARSGSFVLGTTPALTTSMRSVVNVGGPTSKLPSVLPLGCYHVTSTDFVKSVQNSPCPVMLYFHTENHPDVVAYTKDLLKQVGAANDLAIQALAESRGPTAATMTPEEAHSNIVVRLALVDVEKEQGLVQALQVTQFPVILFTVYGRILDQMAGIVPEAHIVQAIKAMIEYARKNPMKPDGDYIKQDKPKGPPPGATSSMGGPRPSATDKPDVLDVDEENVMTLIHAGMRRLQDKEYSKAETLFNKAVALAVPKIDALMVQHNLKTKKMTPEIQEKLKKDPHYLAMPQALTGIALMHLGRSEHDKAAAMSKKIRTEYAWAIRDLRIVADALARIDILGLSGFDPMTDTYVNLLKRDEFINEPLRFYQNNIKLSVAYYIERKHEQALEELLKLIRSEPKLLPVLRQAGICDSLVNSPARKILFLMFEGLGNETPAVVDARKKLAAFLNV